FHGLFFGLLLFSLIRRYLWWCRPARFLWFRFLTEQRHPIIDLPGAVAAVLGKDQFHGLDLIIGRFYREHQYRVCILRVFHDAVSNGVTRDVLCGYLEFL